MWLNNSASIFIVLDRGSGTNAALKLLGSATNVTGSSLVPRGVSANVLMQVLLFCLSSAGYGDKPQI
jgi:hypothetical protein